MVTRARMMMRRRIISGARGLGAAITDEAEREKRLEVVKPLYLQACSYHGKRKRGAHSVSRPAVVVASATSASVIFGASTQIRIHSSAVLSLTHRCGSIY